MKSQFMSLQLVSRAKGALHEIRLIVSTYMRYGQSCAGISTTTNEFYTRD